MHDKKLLSAMFSIILIFEVYQRLINFGNKLFIEIVIC